jgi:hypothetical protein
MMASFESLLPVFLLIALGFAPRARNVIPEDMWRGIEKLGYWVFFPAILLDTMIRSEISKLPLTAVAFTMIAAFLTMALGIIFARRQIMSMLLIEGSTYSSLFQSAVRWNGFIALPILAKLYGDDGVALVAVIIGALVPLANIMAVAVVAQNAGGRRLTLRETIYVVFRNPFIWATALGLAINLAGVPIYAPIMTGLGMLGGAAIGSGLLMVGAGLYTGERFHPTPAVWTGTVLKLIGTPLLMIAWSLVTGVSGAAFVACMVCASVPTAMSAYVLARQLGGDAPLVAATVSMQTIVSFFSIPLVIMIARALQ